jgi:nucleotide-binding universal stress UspA family protein
MEGVTMEGGWMASSFDHRRYDEGQEQFANNILAAARNEAEKLGINANTQHVSNQHPATGILEACAAHDCDLIVMASHGRRGIQRLLLGSQTTEVLANTHAAVLVVR